MITGLSKNLALGGWRIGAARFPAGGWGERIRADVAAVASEIWSTLAGPMQSVARYAFSEPPEIRERLAADARCTARWPARCTGSWWTPAPPAARRPGPSTSTRTSRRCADPLAEQGVTDGASLQRYLLEELGVAVLSGHHFGDRPEALRFRAATSMLYGATPEEQRQTQSAADPLAVPHVADALIRIEQALAKLPR